MNAAITIDGVSKQYRLGQRERYRALRDTLADMLRAPARGVGRLLNGGGWETEAADNRIWALRDISFDVAQGEVIGIVGRNGAGKSTLLKVLSRITAPTEGHVSIHGLVGSLLEVGTGFHPELSGRENVFLNGAILGMKRHDILRKFDEIVAFAEVERFIDTPVKHYSSGMQMRLAFAVAAHLDPEVLIVDEVLAVGDAAFQQKCLGKVGEVTKSGRTVLLVSHQLNQVRRLCNRVVWLDGGRVRQIGHTAEVVTAYEGALSTLRTEGDSRNDGAAARFVSWEVVEPRGDSPHTVGRGAGHHSYPRPRKSPAARRLSRNPALQPGLPNHVVDGPLQPPARSRGGRFRPHAAVAAAAAGPLFVAPQHLRRPRHRR